MATGGVTPLQPLHLKGNKMALYHCSNLGQIAAMFEGKSNEAWQQVSQATTVRRSHELKVIAQTWKNAANILRDTEIHS